MARSHGQTAYYIEGEGFVGGEQQEALLGPGDANERAFRFGRMFGGLGAFRPTTEALTELGLAMDEAANATDHPDLPAGFTYLGQFIDHDITFDKTDGIPDAMLDEREIVQGRSPSLDLDSVYGRGPALEEKALYEADKLHLRVGSTTALGSGTEPEAMALPNDLPRGGANPLEAIIGDPRNDENLVVAQTHLAFLKLHNVVVQHLLSLGVASNRVFALARQAVVHHYQWIVLHDFLPRLIEPDALRVVLNTGRVFFQFGADEMPAMPLEFSVAAYRLGHSMIRPGYSWNRNFPDASLGLLFAFTGNASPNGAPMFGSPSLPSNWPIDWRRFYDFAGVAGVEATPALNHTRTIDTAVAVPLNALPGFPTGPQASLAVRNLLRGRSVGLPSGQAIAEALGVPKLTATQLTTGRHGALLRKHGFQRQTPLWYYILKEAEVLHSGLRLGPVGSRIMAETFVGLVEGSTHSILRNRNWRPWLPAQRPGHFTMNDLLLLVNDLNPLGSEFGGPQPAPQPRRHTVQRGETLRTLAARFLGSEQRWRDIFDANRDVISNPDVIRPGMELVIPEP